DRADDALEHLHQRALRRRRRGDRGSDRERAAGRRDDDRPGRHHRPPARPGPAAGGDADGQPLPLIAGRPSATAKRDSIETILAAVPEAERPPPRIVTWWEGLETLTQVALAFPALSVVLFA